MGLLRLPVDPNDRRALWHGETRRTKFKPVDDNFPRLCLRREGVGGSVRDRATVSHLGIRGGAGQMPARRADSGALNPYLRSSCASGGSIRGRPAHHRYDRAKDVSAPRSDQTTSARRALHVSLLRNESRPTRVCCSRRSRTTRRTPSRCPTTPPRCSTRPTRESGSGPRHGAAATSAASIVWSRSARACMGASALPLLLLEAIRAFMTARPPTGKCTRRTINGPASWSRSRKSR